MVNKWLVSIAGFLVVVVGIQAVLLQATEEDLLASREEVAALTEGFKWSLETNATLEARLKAAPKLQEKRNHAQRKVETAVRSAPAWADQPVPAAVIDSLRE